MRACVRACVRVCVRGAGGGGGTLYIYGRGVPLRHCNPYPIPDHVQLI